MFTKRTICIYVSILIGLAALRLIESGRPSPYLTGYYLDKGHGRFNSGDDAEALRYYQRALKHDSGTSSAYYLARFYRSKGNSATALEYYRRVIETGPNWTLMNKQLSEGPVYYDYPYAEACQFVGAQLLWQEQFVEAIPFFQQARIYRRNWLEALYGIGLAHLGMSNIAFARNVEMELRTSTYWKAEERLQEKIKLYQEGQDWLQAASKDLITDATQE